MISTKVGTNIKLKHEYSTWNSYKESFEEINGSYTDFLSFQKLLKPPLQILKASRSVSQKQKVYLDLRNRVGEIAQSCYFPEFIFENYIDTIEINGKKYI